MPNKPPIIHTNIDVLKGKLHKYEPVKIAKRIGIDATVVIALPKFEYDPSIPIITAKHFKKYRSKKRDASKHSDQVKQRDEKDVRATSKTKSDRLESTRPEEDEEDSGAACESNSDCLAPTRPEEVEILEEDVILEEEAKDDGASCGSNSNQSIPTRPEEVEEDDRAPSESSIDRLVLTGPEEDEFRQYSDDDEADETPLSRNLKKIRTEPPPPPSRPAQPFQQPQRQQRPMQQRTTTANTAKITIPESASTSVATQAVPQAELQIADIDKLLEQKNYRSVYAELNRRKETFKSDEAARSTLRKAISSCLERDDTFMLLEFISLVFEYNYSGDTKFWDELIGKLKRKDNPHAKCITFKCDVEPKLVLHNYRLIVKKIAEYCNANNQVLTLPFNTFCYLVDSIRTAPASSNASAPMESVIRPSHPARVGSSVQVKESLENFDPSSARDVSFYQEDGRRKFKVKFPKGEVKYSAKLLI